LFRFRTKSDNDVLETIIKSLDVMHREDVSDKKQLMRTIFDLESQIKSKKF